MRLIRLLLLCTGLLGATLVQAAYQATVWGTFTFTPGGTTLYASCQGTRVSPVEDPPLTFHCNWNWGDGSPATSGLTSSHTYTASGTYTVTANACLDKDASVCDGPVLQTYIVTLPSNCSGTFSTDGPYTGMPGEEIYVKVKAASCSDWYYVWNFGDGTIDNEKGTWDGGASHKHAYMQAGTYTITVKAYNNADSLKATATTTVKVGDSKFAPQGKIRYIPDNTWTYGTQSGDRYNATYDISGSSDPQGLPITRCVVVTQICTNLDGSGRCTAFRDSLGSTCTLPTPTVYREMYNLVSGVYRGRLALTNSQGYTSSFVTPPFWLGSSGIIDLLYQPALIGVPK